MPVSHSEGCRLWHIDLKESFSQREIVLKRPYTPIPFDPSQYIKVFGCGANLSVVSFEEASSLSHVYNITTKCTQALTRYPHSVSGNLFTKERVTKDDDFQVFHTSNLSTPFISVPCRRGIPGATDGSRMHLVDRQQATCITGGVAVWECMRVQMPEGWLLSWPGRYAITDAETDTLLAFLDSYST
ncbi:hypothetical protein Pelo_17868 [Pelomyxa schiedti]|nr:hypothetical protein Pelo_17868 [Pelomyxa schiedti]